MASQTARNGLYTQPGGAEQMSDFFTDYGLNMAVLDDAVAKGKWDGSAPPSVNDDSGDGYAVGSLWVDIANQAVYVCTDPTPATAVWYKVYPGTISGNTDIGPFEMRAQTFYADVATGTAPLTVLSTTVVTNLNADRLDGLHDTAFVKTSGTNPLTAAWDAGPWQIRAETFQADAVTGTAPFTVASDTVVTSLNADTTDSCHFTRPLVKGDIPACTAAGTFGKLSAGINGYSLVADSGSTTGLAWSAAASGSAAFWTDFPGTPVVGDGTFFTVTDAGNANNYHLRFSPGTLIRWEKNGGGFQSAKIVSATAGTNIATFYIVGNTLAANFTAMKYCIHRPMEDVFIVPGNLPTAATVNINKTLVWHQPRYVISAKVWFGTAATVSTSAFDINSAGTTIFTSKPSVLATATEGVEVASDNMTNTTIAVTPSYPTASTKITLDYDSTFATPGADAYVYLWSFPEAWRYET